MMRFLTTILSRNKKGIDSEKVKDLENEVFLLKKQLNEQNFALMQFGDSLRSVSLALENLCVEINVLGKWAADKEADEAVADELAKAFGGSNTDDDEYLN